MFKKISKWLFIPLIFFFFPWHTNAENVSQHKPVNIDPYLGQRLYDATKFSFGIEKSSSLSKSVKPEIYKIYPNAAKFKLPFCDYEGMALEKVIKRRRSKRPEQKFSHEPLTLSELSQLLFSAAGITGRYNALDLRSAPSAGALYPIEVYLAVNNVTGLAAGIYHYYVPDHSLELFKAGDFRDEIEHAVMKQSGVRDAAVVFIYSAIPARTTHKYDLRGWRYVYMEIGYISENLYLEAASLGLSTTAMGAFYDDEMNKLLDIDGKHEMVLHVQIVGRAHDAAAGSIKD